MIVIGVDLATKTGLARIEDGRLTAHGKVKITTANVAADVASIAAFCAGADLVAVEDVFAAVNIRTSIALATLRGRLLQLLDQAGIRWTLVAPSTWRKSTVRPPPKAKRAALKQLAIDFVATTFAIDVGDDVADAICLALHASTTTR